MKKLLFVVFALMFLLAGCAAKEEQTGGQMEGMTESGGHETTGQMAAMSEEAGHGEMKVTKHYEDSMTKVTDNKLYSLEMVIPHQQLMMGTAWKYQQRNSPIRPGCGFDFFSAYE